MLARKYVSLQVCQYANTPVRNQVSMEACQSASMSVWKYVSMQVYQHVSMSAWKFACLQEWQHASMSPCKYLSMEGYQHASMSACKYVSMQVCQHVIMSVPYCKHAIYGYQPCCFLDPQFVFLFFREWLEEDCCGSGEEECNKEERQEYRVEARSSSYVNSALCELSIKE